jgi:chemosensory pili system protein ChpA (sensor histidine kinase/response regulator)
VLPLTTAVTQVVMLRCGELQVAVPSTLIEVVRRVPTVRGRAGLRPRRLDMGDQVLPFFWLGACCSTARAARPPGARSRWWWCAARRSAWPARRRGAGQPGSGGQARRAAAGAAARPGGRDLLPSGAVALIYNPVALAGAVR